MPYTLSHPAAVLGLGRLGLDRGTGAAGVPLAALVAGSLALDLPYYVALPFGFQLTHSLVGLVSVDLILGLGMYLIWVGVLLRPFLWLAPPSVQRRIPPSRRAGVPTRISSPRAVLVLLLAVLAGASSHLLWDSFTHSGRWATRNVPVLREGIAGVALYSWLQVLSSILGLLVIGWALVRWWRMTPPTWSQVAGPRWPVLAAWALLLGYPLWAAWGRLQRQWVHGRHPVTGQLYTQDLMVTTAFRFTDALVLSVVCFVVVWHLVALSRWLWADPLDYRAPTIPPPATPPGPPRSRRSSADSPRTGHA